MRAQQCGDVQGLKIATDVWNIATDLVNNASLLILIAVDLLKSVSEGCRTTLQPSQFRTR